MGEKRSEEDDLEGITAILLKASRLSEATPELVWTGNKPESAGVTQTSKARERRLMSLPLQRAPAPPSLPQHLPRTTNRCYALA